MGTESSAIESAVTEKSGNRRCRSSRRTDVDSSSVFDRVRHSACLARKKTVGEAVGGGLVVLPPLLGTLSSCLDGCLGASSCYS